MLRHWESLGLLTSASIDPDTKVRRYSASQAGRVRAIATLRAVGFSLDAIRDLLDQGLTEGRLTELLEARQAELTERIAQDSAALGHVRDRLAALARERESILETLTETALSEIDATGVSESVTDEAEIPGAVERLLAALRRDDSSIDQDITLVFDGTTDLNVISVSALFTDGSVPESIDEAMTTTVNVPRARHAVSVRFAQRPGNTGDSWIALDAQLARAGRRTTGPYRQVLHADGAVTIAAPTTAL